jgi:LEA14-like dessication related protein
MSRATTYLAVLVLAFFSATGCAVLDTIELPELTVVNMTLADMTLFETQAEFQVRISNANPDPLILNGGAVHIYLEGIKIGKGLLSERVEIPRFDSVTVTLPVYVNNLSVATRMRPILESKQLNYRIKGVLFREGAGLGPRKLRTASEGTFNFGETESQAP